MQSKLLFLERHTLVAMAQSLHFLLAKGNNQLSTCIVFTQIPKYGRFLFIYQYPLLTIKSSSHIIRWITENNQPININNDRKLCNLVTAGRQSIDLPTRTTISQDINTTFEKCQEHIAKLLQVCSQFLFTYQYN